MQRSNGPKQDEHSRDSPIGQRKHPLKREHRNYRKMHNSTWAKHAFGLANYKSTKGDVRQTQALLDKSLWGLLDYGDILPLAKVSQESIDDLNSIG